MATVLISGGSGLLGKHLGQVLLERGYEIAVLSRSAEQKGQIPSFKWDPAMGEIDQEAISRADYIIHLAGASIADKRWTSKRKKEIVESRINSGQLIFDTVRKQNSKLKAFISASAIGYYGSGTSSEIFNETDLPGEDFLGKTCLAWEQVADRFMEAGIRTVKIRTGIVLSRQGGALAKMILPVKMGIGAALGNGKQYLPWIHIDDLSAIYIKAIEDAEMTGSYNAVAPEHDTNMDFTRTLARVHHKKLWAPKIPAFMMKLIFGEMSVILLEGSRISSEKIQASGYKFLYPGLEGALEQLSQ